MHDTGNSAVKDIPGKGFSVERRIPEDGAEKPQDDSPPIRSGEIDGY